MQPSVVYPNQAQVQTTTVVQTVPPPSHPPDVNPYYYSKASIGLGATQVIIGILAFIFQCVGLGSEAPLAPGGTGIWMGVFFIITGSLGIGAGKTNKKSLIIAFMVMSIFAIFLACGLVGVGSTSLIIGNVVTGYDCNYYGWGYTAEVYDDCIRKQKAQNVSDAFLVALGFVEFFIAIISSGFGCGGICCCLGPSPTQGVAYHNQGAVIIQGGAVGGYPGQIQQSYVVQGQAYPTQPPAYQGQGYPPLGQAYAPQGQGYPPQGQAHAPQGQAYPPPNQVYPQPGQGYPQQGQAYPQQGQPPQQADQTSPEKAKF